MTKIPQVNIWVEAEAFDSITDDDIALGIVAATEAAECNTKRSSSPSAVRLRRCPAIYCHAPESGGGSSTSVRVRGRVEQINHERR